MRQTLIGVSVLALLTACSTTSTSSSPYQQPEGPNTASVRFRVANVSRWAHVNLGAVFLSHYADDQCGASPQGRYIDEIGTNKTFVSRANQSIGMPKFEEYPPYLYVERRFVADKPLVFSLVAASGGPARICQGSYQFVPSPGRMYEITIDVLGPQECPVHIAQIQKQSGAVVGVAEPSARPLQRFCQSPSIFN